MASAVSCMATAATFSMPPLPPPGRVPTATATLGWASHHGWGSQNHRRRRRCPSTVVQSFTHRVRGLGRAVGPPATVGCGLLPSEVKVRGGPWVPRGLGLRWGPRRGAP
jgi:hypothetical protein